MRAPSRTAVSTFVALMLAVILAVPASAGQIISYRGTTSADRPNRIAFKVLKRDNGQRLLRSLSVHHTLTCEDGTTIRYWIGFGWSPGVRLSEAGEFSYDAGQYFAVEGVIGFRKASGTFESVWARLNDDHTDAQVCTTGELTWTAERADSRPARLTVANLREGTGFTKVRVTDGVAEVVKLVEP